MGGIVTFIPIILMIVLFYFLLIRPQQKRQKEVQNMQNSLAKGDKIITIGGLHGIVEAIEDGTVILKCGNSKLTFDRNAIRTVLEKGNGVVTETASDDTEVVEDNK
ncbi:preprotein translocase subunit YajC [Listeria monocytogenes]|uniref:Preprotein translocase subunit YajC n=1 Tax=Listeria monocytogenes TaxID=1639 RepID=A0A6V9TMI8_LISMN|nr:preprotein translocase subunit YajC [Listeria monocytogenes]EAC6872012.1 preprotein translocase subunit YajC [Listeria monocytogenes]EAC7884531.1 preprotein translocase subunit YajC [Listeria monocytogenes]EAC8432340.1 preprotein translocase subunit YajC [Listeria monocytogenes]EAC8463977.1 preprotein translocase subunit YajC [Listeria monocytogenes]EAD1931932.1 preprotein translocase subunit YajC [Listeria monocytogenes]